MVWSTDPNRAEGFSWRCRKRVAGIRCRGTPSIRHGSRFQLSNLTLMELILFTYILHRDPAHRTENELGLSDHTVADWGMFCRETMLEFLEGSSEKIGGPNKTIEIDDSKIGRWKYNRVSGCLAVSNKGPAEHLFPSRTESLTAIICKWIEPGTMVISDCWGAYHNFDSQGYTHRTVNHSLYFNHPDPGDHTNTIESTWHCLKVFLQPYNRADYRYHLAHYMFAVTCKAREHHLSSNSCISSRAPIGPVYN